MSYPRWIRIALPVATLVIAGCGGGSKPSKSTNTIKAETHAAAGSPVSRSVRMVQMAAGPKLSQAQLVAKASATCKSVAVKRNRLRFSTGTQFELILPVLASYQKRLLTELGKLAPPTAMTSQWTQMITYAETLARSTAELNHLAHTTRRADMASLQGTADHLYREFAQARLRMRSVAKQMSIPGCAEY